MGLQVEFFSVGESAVMVKFGSIIEPNINRAIRQVADIIEAGRISGIGELVPTYADLLISFDPLCLSVDKIEKIVNEALEKISIEQKGEVVRIIEIPTCYEAPHCLDMQNVMEHTKLSAEEIVSIHTSKEYLVYMMGFMPGFCYLGGMDERIATPRLKTPRDRIEAGAVGIAGSQTGIYPSVSPGGWQIIGRTPVNMYDLRKDNPSAVKSGDYIRYKSISNAEFDEIFKAVQEGSFSLHVEEQCREWN